MTFEQNERGDSQKTQDTSSTHLIPYEASPNGDLIRNTNGLSKPFK